MYKNQNELPLFYTRRQTMRLLNYKSVDTILKLERQGHLTPVRPTGRFTGAVRYRRSEVEAITRLSKQRDLSNDEAIDAGFLVRRLLVTKREVSHMLGIHWTTIDRWRRDGKFPQGIMLGPQVLRFKLVDVEAWLSENEAQGNPLEEGDKQ